MKPAQTKALITASGVFLLLLAGGAALLLLVFSDAPEAVESIEQVAESASTIEQPSATPTVTETEVTPTVEKHSTVTPTFSEPTIAPTVAPVLPENTDPTAVPVLIEWTDEEKNALSWMCNDEIGGMGASVIRDACLSVISTVRARYAYPNGFTEKDVIGTLLRPNQFSIEVQTETPNTRFYSIVEEYQDGARGSCNGFLFFDSVPDGPSLCQIYGVNGMFVEFHDGW